MKKLKFMMAEKRFAKEWTLHEYTFEEFSEKYLEKPTVTPETFEEFMALTKDEQNNLKDQGGYVPCEFETTRRVKNQKGKRYAITLDADNMGDVKIQDVLNKLYALDVKFVLHSTRKHRPEAPRIRIVVPLDTPIDLVDYPALAQSFAEYIDINIIDKTSFQAERLMYFPSISSNAEYVFESDFFADELKADEWFEKHPVKAVESVKTENKIEQLEDPREKEGIIGAFCRAYTITEAIEKYIPEVYDIIDDTSATYVQGSTAAGLKIYDDLHAYSFHSTDPAGGNSQNAFDLVRIHKFSHLDDEKEIKKTISRRASYKAMKELAIQDIEVRKELDKINVFKKEEQNTEKVNKELLKDKKQKIALIENNENKVKPDLKKSNNTTYDLNDNSIVELLRGWAYYDLTADNKGKICATVDNFYKIMKNDRLIQNKFAFDEFSRRDFIRGNTPWNAEKKDRHLNNNDLAGLMWYIEKIYTVRDKQCMDAALSMITYENRFNLVKEYLEKTKWDGKTRLETYFIDWLGAEDNIYTRQVTQKMLIAGIKRAIEENVQFEQVLVLAGAQGAGKTTTIKKLAPWAFNDNIHDFSGKNKNVAEELQGKWIIELAELKGFKKAESEALKNFLSKTEDTYREPYKQLATSHPRRCIFFGSTNNNEYLKDKTGNRRYWPLDINNTMEEWLEKAENLTQEYIDQVWAEAYEIYKKGEYSLYLTKEAEEIANRERENHMVDDPKMGMLEEYLEKEITEDWYNLDLMTRRNILNGIVEPAGKLVKREKVCALEVLTELFGSDKNLVKTFETSEINLMLGQVECWTKNKHQLRFGEYGKQITFIRK